MQSEEPYAKRAFKAGAAGYTTNDSSQAEFSKAIDRVIKAGQYVSPEIAEKLATRLEKSADAAPHEALSDREFQVMDLIASGKTVNEIGELLNAKR